jgi:hypothetical protein
MTQENNPNILNHYLKLVSKTVSGIQEKICEKNSISLNPRTADELCPIPVFEHGIEGLLHTANEARRPTNISWITSGTYAYLNAYVKSFRDPETGRKHSEIVVTTPNYCSARFFAAKELMHCFIDDDGYPATDSIELTRALIDDLVASGAPHTEPQTVVDEIAWFGAACYLIPDSWVEPINKTIIELSKEDPANAYVYVAHKIRAPEGVLRARLRFADRFK